MTSDPLTTPSTSSWESLRGWVTASGAPSERARRIAVVKAAVEEWPVSVRRAPISIAYDLRTGADTDLHPLCNHLQLNTTDITAACMDRLVALAHQEHIAHLTLWGEGAPARVDFLQQVANAGLVSIEIAWMNTDDAVVLAGFAPTVRELVLLYRVEGGEAHLGASEVFAALTRLHIEGSRHSGRLLHALVEGGPHPIQHLSIKHNVISDADLRRFLGAGSTPALEALELIGTRGGLNPPTLSALSVLEAPGLLPALRDLKMEILSLDDAAVRVLVQWDGVSQLRQLDLTSNRIQDAGAVALSEVITGAVVLDNNQIGAAGLRALIDNLSPQQPLSVRRNPIGDAGAAVLCEGERMRRLIHREKLDLDLARLTDVGVGLLASSPAMGAVRWLSLTGSNMTDVGAAALAASPHTVGLRGLSAEGAAITDAGVLALAGLPELFRLDVHRTWLSHLGIEALKSDAPGLQLRTGQPRGPAEAAPDQTVTLTDPARDAVGQMIAFPLPVWVGGLDLTLSDTPIPTLKAVLSAPHFARLRRLSLRFEVRRPLAGGGVMQQLKKIRSIREIEQLTLTGLRMDRSGVAFLAGCRFFSALTTLDLSGCTVDAAALAGLGKKAKKLTTLHLGGKEPTRDLVTLLSALPRLSALVVPRSSHPDLLAAAEEAGVIIRSEAAQ